MSAGEGRVVLAGEGTSMRSLERPLERERCHVCVPGCSSWGLAACMTVGGWGRQGRECRGALISALHSTLEFLQA